VPTTDELIALEPEGFPDDAEHEELVGSWRMFQRRRGHRTSTDDVVTAWLAVALHGDAAPGRYLDLGCGVGSVMLLVAHRLRPRLTIGVEAQAQSALLAERSVRELPAPPSIEVRRGDLRDVVPETHGVFDLVTGSPPYFPLGTGVLSPDAQRRACRFELRGGVEAYCAAAARVLGPGGTFALVFPSDGDERTASAATAAGLSIVAKAALFMRKDRAAPFLTVWGLAREPRPLRELAFAIRDEHGEITPEYREARALLGLR
jgi:tRNA1(Val) A37 N6-methylase TrmN6